MGNEHEADRHQIAESRRRQALERLNADFQGLPESVTPVAVSSSQEGAEKFAVYQEKEVIEPASPDIPDEFFHASSKSPAGKSLRWFSIAMVTGLVIGVAGSGGSFASAGFGGIVALAIAALVDRSIRHRKANDMPAVVLNREGIASRLFLGEPKQYPWHQISEVSVEILKHGKALQLRLDPSAGYPDQRRFWSGLNPARPAIPLASLEPAAQETLFEAIQRRLHPENSDAGNTANPLAEERKLLEQLKAFAPVPWVTYGLVAINVAVWLMMLFHGGGFGMTPTDRLFQWGGNAASEVQRGEWWRLATAIFLHSGFMHVALNMFGLASAGVTVERIYGHRQFFLLYFGSGLIGSALSLHFSAQHAVSVGASGAVFGIAGALLVGVYQHRKRLPASFGKQIISSMGTFIVLSLIQGGSKPGIDNAAHIGGLLGGCLLAYLLPERFDMAHFVRTKKTRAMVGIGIVLAAFVGLIAGAPQAEVDQRRVFEGHAAFQQAFKEFSTALQAIKQEEADVKAGKLSERESDERSRTVFAPMLRKVHDGLARVDLIPGDPRSKLLADARKTCELLIEMVAMPSVFEAGSDKPKPSDPERVAAIETELQEIAARMDKMAKELQESRKRRR